MIASILLYGFLASQMASVVSWQLGSSRQRKQENKIVVVRRVGQ